MALYRICPTEGRPGGYFDFIHWKGKLEGALSLFVHMKDTGDVYICYMGFTQSDVILRGVLSSDSLHGGFFFFKFQSMEGIPEVGFGLFFVCLDKAVNQPARSLKSTRGDLLRVGFHCCYVCCLGALKLQKRHLNG